MSLQTEVHKKDSSNDFLYEIILLLRLVVSYSIL